MIFLGNNLQPHFYEFNAKKSNFYTKLSKAYIKTNNLDENYNFALNPKIWQSKSSPRWSLL